MRENLEVVISKQEVELYYKNQLLEVWEYQDWTGDVEVVHDIVGAIELAYSANTGWYNHAVQTDDEGIKVLGEDDGREQVLVEWNFLNLAQHPWMYNTVFEEIKLAFNKPDKFMEDVSNHNHDKPVFEHDVYNYL